MADKSKKRKSRKLIDIFSLRDEPIEQPIDTMLAKDHPQHAHTRFNQQDNGKRLMTTRTEMGRRIYGGCLQNSQCLEKHVHRSHEFTNIPQVGGTGLSQKDILNSFVNNRLVEELRTENEVMDGSYEQEHDQGGENDYEITRKETRGPTYMQNVWGRPSNLPRYHVDYNEFGQPIGGESSKLSHFLGSIARNGKYCPLDVVSWRVMPTEKKTEMLDVVKIRFHAPIISEKWILSSIGHKWRNWKHFLKTRYWVPNISLDCLKDERDERVLPDQWLKLLTFWNSNEAEEASQKNTNARAKRIMDQITGKMSFAQVRDVLTKKLGRPPKRFELFAACYIKSNGSSCEEALRKYEEMKELHSQLPEGSDGPINRNDVFSQIMGQDRPGYVRMMGQGICPSDVWGQVPRDKANHLLVLQQSKIAHLESLLGQQTCGATRGNGHDIPTFDSPSSDVTTLPLLDGAYVSLKSLFDPTKIIAKGCIHSTNPSTEVGGQILGSNWCEVNIKVILEPEEQLIRPYDNIQKIAGTLGEMIAWPCHLVTRNEVS